MRSGLKQQARAHRRAANTPPAEQDGTTVPAGGDAGSYRTRLLGVLASIRITPFEILCGLGLSFNFVWCTLEGHSSGFLASAQDFGETVNTRIYFQLGILLAALLMFAASRALSRHERQLRWIIPAASVLATFLYAWPQQGVLDPAFHCAVGLTVSGFGYCWLATRFYLLIAQRRGFVSCVVATALCLVFKETLLAFLIMMPIPWLQVCIAAAMPLCMALVHMWAAHIADGCAKPAPVQDAAAVAAKGRAASPSMRATMVHAAVLALLLATMRGFSRLGMWGTEEPGALGAALPIVAMVISIVSIAAFAVFALILPAGRPAAARFRPATLILLTGLSLIALQSYFGTDVVPYTLSLAEELLSHMAFWAATSALLIDEKQPSFRTASVPLIVYSASSVLFVLLMSRTTAAGIVFVLIVFYLVFAIATKHPGDEGPRAAAGDPSRTEPASTGEALAEAMGRTCTAMVETYCLSPREAQILPMVVEGRSRSYICEQLALSDSTVKTHISHIYEKCSVVGRQGLVDLVFQTSTDQEDGRAPGPAC